MADENVTPAEQKAAPKKPAAKKAAPKADASADKAAPKKPATKKAAVPKAETQASDAKAAPKKPAVKKAAPKADAADKPAVKKAAPKADAADKPAAKKPAAKAAAATTGAGASAVDAAPKKPAAKKAAADKPAADKSAGGAKVTTLKVHHLRPADGAHKRKIRVGRGEASKGKTAGRGTKGTGARNQVPARFEGGQTPIHMRIPKLPGFRNPNKVTFQVVNVGQLGALFPQGGDVTKADLVSKGAVRKNQPVKVLGNGDIAVKLTLVDADKVSQSARTKIEAAGGSVNEG